MYTFLQLEKMFDTFRIPLVLQGEIWLSYSWWEHVKRAKNPASLNFAFIIPLLNVRFLVYQEIRGMRRTRYLVNQEIFRALKTRYFVYQEIHGIWRTIYFVNQEINRVLKTKYVVYRSIRRALHSRYFGLNLCFLSSV